MKTVFEYVIYNWKEILLQDSVIAEDETQALLQIGIEVAIWNGDMSDNDLIDLADGDTKVEIRSFCRK